MKKHLRAVPTAPPARLRRNFLLKLPICRSENPVTSWEAR